MVGISLTIREEEIDVEDRRPIEGFDDLVDELKQFEKDAKELSEKTREFLKLNSKDIEKSGA